MQRIYQTLLLCLDFRMKKQILILMALATLAQGKNTKTNNNLSSQSNGG